QIEPLLGLAMRTRFLRVHVQAVSAAVDLRRADLDQLEQRRLEGRPSYDGSEAQHGLDGIAVAGGVECQTSIHLASPCVDCYVSMVSTPSRRPGPGSCDNRRQQSPTGNSATPADVRDAAPCPSRTSRGSSSSTSKTAHAHTG